MSDANSPQTKQEKPEGLISLIGAVGSFDITGTAQAAAALSESTESVDMVNHPPHYSGPNIECPKCGHIWAISCIQIIRGIRDGRLFSAMKYIWRVSLGGGKGNDVEDIDKARWFLTDFIELPSTK